MVGGRPLRITAVRDITERRRAERALQTFRYSIDQASDAVFWMNREGGFSYVNEQACHALGYTCDELLRLHLWDIDPAYTPQRWFERWTAYQDDRHSGAEHRESCHRRKDGSLFPVEVVSRHLWLGDEELQVAFVRDITERKRAEEALRRSEANLQLALEAAGLGDWSWDIVTGEIVWSARCKALYGLSPETAVTYERFLECLHPDDRERVDAALRRAVEERSDYEVEKRAVWPDGSVHWTATRGRVSCDDAGEPVRVAGVQRSTSPSANGWRTALREKTEELDRFFTTTLDLLCVADTDGYFRRLNPQWEAVLGYSLAELEGQTFPGLHPSG